MVLCNDVAKDSMQFILRPEAFTKDTAFMAPLPAASGSGNVHDNEFDPTMSFDEENGRAVLGMTRDAAAAAAPPPPQTMVPVVSYWKLFQYATMLDYGLMLIGSLSALLHGVSSPVVVLLFGYMNNAYQSSVDDPHKAYREVSKIVLIITYIGLGTMVSAGIELICWMQVGERQATHLKKRYLEALLKQEIAYYDTEAKIGDVVSGISNDITLIHDAVGEKVGTCFSNMGIFLGGIGLSISVSWKMGLLGLTSTPLLLGSAGVFITYYTKYIIEAMGAYKEADLVAEQAISQVRTVYAYVGEHKAMKSFGQLLDKAVKVSTKTGLSKGLGLGTMLAVSYLSWALQFWYGGTLVDRKEIKGGTVNSLIFISVLSGKALGESLQMLEHIAKGKAAASKLLAVIERKPKIDSSSLEGKVLQQVHGKIELHKVSFCYPSRPEVPVLKHMTLKIPQGKIVALVGSSGCGKSTVISLIQRFYDPLEGQVRIDGRDIKTLQLKWLRQQIGLVSQEPTLLATSIKKNIMLGKPDASHEEVVSAAKVANAHLFICELPEAYNTEVGDRGIQLSGGQRQRVAIARAIIKKPAIILLDEATSALDAESELLVQTALDNVMQGRTTVVVAHRLSTIRNADMIVVFDKGHIVESGTHEQLLSLADGFYTKLVKAQDKRGTERSRSRIPESPLRTRTAADYDEIVKKSPSRFSFDSSFSASDFPSPGPSKYGKTIEEFVTLPPSYSKRTWFKSLFSRVWTSAVVGTLGAVVSGILAAVFPLAMANIIVLLLERRVHEAGSWILAFVGLAVGSLVSNLVQYFYWHEVGAKVCQNAEEKCFEGILRNEVGWFDFEENSSTAVTAKLSTNSTLLRNVLSDTWSYLLQNVLGVFLALVLAIIYDWRMGLLSLAILPFQVLGSAVTTGYSKDGFAGDVGKYHEKAGRLAGEAVSSIRTVLSYGASDSILQRFQELVAESSGRRLKRACKMGAFLGVSHGLLYVSNAFCMWYGVVLLRKKEASFGALIISFSIVSYTAYNCLELLRLVPDVSRGIGAAHDLFALGTRVTGIDSDTGGAVVKCLGHVELRDVTFRYPSRPDSLVLDNVSLRVNSGSTLALVGSSGSGKSSVLALVLRFYDPLLGGVFLDGRDIRTLSARALRSHIGFVQQEPVLFDASIRDNIAYGATDDVAVTEQEVVNAAILANAHDFISALPDGYNTNAGQRGAQLSGGQRQRIAIARAVLKNPRLLLLDEATSALDAESERVVQEAIDRLVGVGIGRGGRRRQQQRTTIVVAHRLSTIQSADTIVVMEQGRIVEQGRHSQLLERDGPYARLMSLQQR